MENLKSIFKISALMLLVVFGYSPAHAQLNGSYTVGGASPDYSTLSAAVSALNSQGVSGSVEFLIRDGNYSGNSWRGIINNVTGASASNRITFRSQSGNKGDVIISNNSSSNYIFRFNNAKYITVKDMTLNKNTSSYCRVFDFTSQASNDSVINCTIKANATQSSSNYRALVYAYGHTGSNNVFVNNDFVNGGQWIYWRGSNTSSTAKGALFVDNNFTATYSGYYGIYTYYTSGFKFLNNDFNRVGSSTYYFGYCYFANDDFEFTDNTVFVKSTGTMYGMRFYYMNYYSNNATSTPKIHNNDFTMEGTYGSVYPFYTYRARYATYLDNEINVTVTSGRIYGYGPLYYNEKSRASDNVFNYTTNSSGRIYNQYMAYNGASYADTMTNNVFNLSARYLYNYLGYYGNTIITDNEYNLSTTYGTIYNYLYYANGLEFARNKIKATSTTGTIYGLYEYGTSSYSGANIHNNDFDISSISGTVYGANVLYSKSKYSNNVFTSKTAGTNYTLRVYRTYNSKFINNTFHSLSTGNTNYIAYIYNTSASYKSELKNNIFSKSASTGYGIWAYNKSYFSADNNLYYVPGGTLFYSNNPSYTGNSMQDWRDKTGNDMNSLIYNPPYMDAANRDFRIMASSPAAWAVNGRAEHDTTIVDDMAGSTRPKFLADGVPDIGAYEVDPTSTPPLADATPSAPVANTTQVFTFGQDTVATIDWGATVPTTYDVRQYSGEQAAPMPLGVGRMFFHTEGTPSTWVHDYKPHVFYKDFWLGDIPGGESETVVARSSNNGIWEGYNYSNSVIDIVRNTLSPAADFDSVGGFTGVQNGRIGIRCVEEPKGLAITNITAFVADIDWEPVFNPIGYQVVMKTVNEEPSQSEWNNANFPTTNSMAASGLTEDTKYYTFVRSICGLKDTSGYAMDSFETLITCHVPDVKLTDVNGTRAVVYWNEIKTAHKYEYVMNTSPTPPSFGTDINKNSVLAPFLDNGTQYYVHVRAHCSSIYEKSDWATTSFDTWATGVNSVQGDGLGLSIHPNPVKNQLVVTIGGQLGKDAVITVMDVTGKTLKIKKARKGNVTINVSQLPSGVYIVQYADNNRNERLKFNKQ